MATIASRRTDETHGRIGSGGPGDQTGDGQEQRGGDLHHAAHTTSLGATTKRPGGREPIGY